MQHKNRPFWLSQSILSLLSCAIASCLSSTTRTLSVAAIRWNMKPPCVTASDGWWYSPLDFLHTQEQSTDESIETYKEFKRLMEEYSDEQFVPSIVEQFCKRVYEDDDNFIFFKPFCNLYFSVYADALLMYQQGKTDYSTFCREFLELSWMDGKRTPLDGKQLKMYIMSMREVVEAYKKLSC